MQRIFPAVALLALAVGCSKSDQKRPETQTEAEPAPTEASAEPAAKPAENTAPADALLTSKDPLPTPAGEVPVYLDRAQTLHIGTQNVKVPHSDPSAHHWTQARLDVVDLTGEQKAVLLTTPTSDSEDPPNRYRLFVAEESGVRAVFDEVVGVYGVQPLSIAGDGTVSFTEDGWTACERAGHPKSATLQKVIYRMQGEKLAEAEREDTPDSYKCGELAACPYVYVMIDGEAVQQGEILRHLRGRSAYALQALPLPPTSGDPLIVELREEKPEITHLDEIYVTVDGVRVAPSSCQASAPPDYCQEDARSHRLHRGDRLTLSFDVPAESRGSRVELWARGYYVPTPL